MNRIFFIFLLVAGLFSVQNLNAQDDISPEDITFLQAKEDSLGLLAYAMVNDSLEENRFLAVRAFIPMLVNALKKPNSFHYPFSQLQTISIQYDADSTFRVFTWQLYVDKDTYKYYGAIQKNNKELELIPLVDRSDNITGDLEQQLFDPKEWYGMLYYNIKTVERAGQKYYLLFGFDGYQFFRKRKIVDVLTFVDGQPQFGSAVFIDPEDQSTKNRIVLEYSAAASIRCNYDEALNLLIFDHLEEIGGEYGEGPVNIPDGTYEAYELKEGQWVYKRKVFDQVLDEAPRPSPILNTERGKSKNIIGKDGNG